MSKTKCQQFCKKKYLPTLKRFMEKPKYKKMGRYYLPYYSLTSDKNWGYKTCLKGFCNPTCKNYEFRSKKRQQEWNKTRKNGFHTSYTPEQISNYKKEGALSGCVEGHNMYNL